MGQGFAVVAVLLLAIATPGWALLAASGVSRDWKVLQRWCLALTLGCVFYPVLFYAVRLVPGLSLGRFPIIALLLVAALAAVWGLRRDAGRIIPTSVTDWIALAVIAATLFTRFWIIRDQPYPAWSDSLHHVLITQLTAATGRLPTDLAPYAPTPLHMYHLGLYSLSAVAQWLSGAPSHTALLWTSQTLNGLSGLGVFLVLDRKVGRTAALVGLTTVGLFSHQPAYYVNWGRFTQVASQAVLLVAFLITWEAIRAWPAVTAVTSRQKAGYVLLGGLLNAGVFLLHFRVAAFYLALLGLALAWELHRAARGRRFGSYAAAALSVGAASFFFAFPAILPAVTAYLGRAAAMTADASAEQAAGQAIYHAISWQAIPELVARPWLLALAALAVVVVLIRRNRVGLLALSWMLLLAAIGNAHRLGIAALDVTNFSGVLIAFYLPLALLIGAAAQEVLGFAPPASRMQIKRVLLGLTLFAGFIFSHARVADVEPHRYFVTPTDVAAMAWIDQNIPSDARFAINTYFWMPQSPHGTDAGYWIPYFTRRQTTADTMLFPLSDNAYREQIVRMSKAADELNLVELRTLGVRYIYSGARGDFAGVGLRKDVLATVGKLRLLYENDGASVWEIEEGGS